MVEGPAPPRRQASHLGLQFPLTRLCEKVERTRTPIATGQQSKQKGNTSLWAELLH